MELAVLADFLRQRVTELEHGHRHGDDTALETSSTTKQLQANLHAAQVSLRQSQIRQRALEEEVATFEAEIADDRELLNLAAQQDGIGVAEAIRRNKQLRSILRKREQEIESRQDELSVI